MFTRQKRQLRHRYMKLGKVKGESRKDHREPILPAPLVADMSWPRECLCYGAMNMVRIIREWNMLPTFYRNEKSTYIFDKMGKRLLVESRGHCQVESQNALVSTKKT